MAIKKVTIKDVAREANVSISTVSNALNDVDVLHPDTKAHILEVAKRLNYIPNLHGKRLKTRITKTIGMFLSSIKGPYYGTLVDSIADACDQNQYDLNVFIAKSENAIMNNILGRQVDGAIILTEHVTDKNINLIKQGNIPLVFLDREKVDTKISSVIFSSYKGGRIVAQHLIDLGFQKIGYIHGVREQYDDQERFRGFKETLEAEGIPFKQKYLLDGSFEEEVAYQAVIDHIESGNELPEAFFAANDLSAIGCIKALQSKGFQVPQDITVVGFDDIEISEYFHGGLTTVRNPIKKQGVLAVERLIAIINGEEKGSLQTLDGELIIRNSCSYLYEGYKN